MVKLSRPSIKRADMDSVLSRMLSDELHPGTTNKEFVKSLADALGLQGGFALGEYSRTVEIALRALELPEGAAVILSPLAPPVYHAALRRLGLSPVYLDVAASAPVLDTAALVARVAEGSSAAVVIDSSLGFLVDYESLGELPIPIIEDVSSGIGGYVGEQSAGSVGRLVIIGLGPETIITAGGGGAVLCRNTRDKAALSRIVEEYPVDILLSDMNAALGLTQVKQLDHFVSRRREIAGVLLRALQRGRHRVPVQPGDGENVWTTFPVIVDGSVSEVQQYAKKHGVATVPAFDLAALENRLEKGNAPGDLSEARRFAMRTLRFPLYPLLPNRDIEQLKRVLSTLP
ncbi:MAG: DegT/DnrJ/EryC1/StrS family aminotransferase [Spirochaetaceae bacterium]